MDTNNLSNSGISFDKADLNNPGSIFIDNHMDIFKVYLEQSPISIVLTDSNGTIMYVNRKFTEVTGYKLEEAVGNTPRVLKSGEHDQEFYTILWKTISSGKVWKGEFINKRKDGTFYNEHVVIAPVFNNENQIVNYIGMKEDITELKNVLVKKNILLENREKMIRDLKALKYEAEAANRSKSIFIASMSHEIRTPMNSIIGFTDALLREDDIRDEYKRMLQMVKSSGEKLLEILNNILDISKIEAGTMTINKISFDVLRMFEELYRIFKPIAVEKGLNLVFKKEGVIPRILVADEAKIRQIFVQLLSNAVKFTETGSVEAIIYITQHSGKKYLNGVVKDTGCGIEEGKADKIFNYFERILDADDRKARGGTGLGLAIVKEYTHMLGGEILVTSYPGQGSSFSFYVDVDFIGDANLIENMNNPILHAPLAKEVIRKDCCNMPVQLLERLKDSIISGDMECISGAIGEISKYSRDLGIRISKMVDGFKYDEAIKLIDQLLK